MLLICLDDPLNGNIIPEQFVDKTIATEYQENSSSERAEKIVKNNYYYRGFLGSIYCSIYERSQVEVVSRTPIEGLLVVIAIAAVALISQIHWN